MLYLSYEAWLYHMCSLKSIWAAHIDFLFMSFGTTSFACFPVYRWFVLSINMKHDYRITASSIAMYPQFLRKYQESEMKF